METKQEELISLEDQKKACDKLKKEIPHFEDFEKIFNFLYGR